MKLNKKGYMLVEIILAFAITFSLVYFIMDLVIEIKNKNDDLLVETLIKTDQSIISNKLLAYAIENVKNTDDADRFCNNISIDGQKILYEGNIIDIVDDYAIIGINNGEKKICTVKDGKVIVNIPIDVKQSKEEFNILFDYKYDIGDYIPPECSSDLIDSTLKSTFKDTIGVVKYYFGISDPSKVDVKWDMINSTTDGNHSKEINSMGTYYFSAKDRNDNMCLTTNKIYLVDYDMNGGTGEIASQYKLDGKLLKLSSTIPSRTGYTFLGWSTSKDATSVTYAAGGDFTLNNKTTLYAVWDAKVVTVVFDKNDGSNYILSQKFTYDDLGNKFGYNIDGTAKWDMTGEFGTWGRTGYSLLGWSTDKDATSATYSIYSGVSNEWINTNSPRITLYAVWKSHIAYAVYSTTDNSLRFYRTLTVPQEGSIYNELDVTNVYTEFETNMYDKNDVPWKNIMLDVKTIIFEDNIKPISTSYWFENGRNVSFVDVRKLDVSNVKDMRCMFRFVGYSSSSLEIDGLNDWNVSKVENMSSMFDFTGKKSLVFNIGDLSDWNPSNVTDMSNMFNSTGASANIFNIGDLSDWDVSNVKDMSCMFCSTGSTANTFNIGDIGEWNVSNVTNMSNMFQSVGSKAKTWFIGYLNQWDTSKVSNMVGMFSNAGIYASNWNIGDIGEWNVLNVFSMYSMFDDAGVNAEKFFIGDLSKWDTSNVTNMYRMFHQTARNSNTFIIGDISNWKTSNVTDMQYMFWYAGEKANYKLNLSNWDVSKVKSDRGRAFNIGVESKIVAPIGFK